MAAPTALSSPPGGEGRDDGSSTCAAWSLSCVLDHAARRVEAATAPDQNFLDTVAVSLGCVALLGAISVPFGLRTGFLERAERPPSSRAMLSTAVRTAVCPALVEEALWRAALLPQPRLASDAALSTAPSACWLRYVLGLTFFVAYHVPAAWLLTRLRVAPGAFRAFTDWRFLVLATGLGVACTVAYAASGGSLWAAAFVHWLPVNVWLLCFGGEALLRGEARQDDDGGSAAAHEGCWQGSDESSCPSSFEH
eukprot:TRINITY_DN71915_c0_g1_i1.p1 TRINITY_DN71915_c0_g1~~TRINITY_DN71915_c0_g1_i1.p1  ORF type:complete len:268 (+),score=64.31 TRINITY_DN71915_c0_g1_i1:50-805(+)